MKTGNKAGFFRKLALAAFVFVFLSDLSATSVSTNLAGMAALTWLQTGNRLGMGARSDIGSIKVFSTVSGAAFNVVHLRNGGFVVTSNDTDIEPIIAFSGTSDFVENPQSPLWVMLDRDLAARARKCKIAAKSPSARAVPLSTPAAQWARLTRGASLGTELRQDVDYALSADGAISDVRVEPLLETKWSQEDPCYNFYTPNNYPCGCVATATAQIMRYFRYPTGSVMPRTNTCNVQSGTRDIGGGYYEVLFSPMSLTMQGGVYDWNNMPATPGNGISDVERKAIGKLTSDVGIACFMRYAEDSSGTGGYVAGPALTGVFGYANALPIVAPGGSGGYFPAETIRQILISNLDAKLPVLTSLEGPYGGHGAVADGYGYSSGTFFVHFNLGWGGLGDSWYAPPMVDEFTAIDTFVYNIYPDGKEDGVICSGRVTTSAGLPIVGAKVSVPNPGEHKRGECTTDENGVYALILSEGTYDVTASNAQGDSVRSVTLKACEGTRVVMDVRYALGHLGTVNNVYGFDFTLEPDATAVVAAYSVPKAVTLLGAVYDGCDVVGGVELKLGKVNGKTGTGKVSGSVTTLDGMKHTMKAFTLTGIDGTAPKVASLEVKDLGTMAITIGGTQFAGTLGRYHVQSADVGGNWTRTDASVYVDATSASLPSGTLEDCLPVGEPVIAAAGKWKFAKAASVKWAKPKNGAATPEIYDEASGKGLVVDTAGEKTNLSGLKITYTPKKGTFKGSFKLYVLEGAGTATKLKKYTVKVSGVVVDGVGYGTATCRNPALAWTVKVN